MLTPSPQRPAYIGSKITFGQAADSLIQSGAPIHEVKRAYGWHPGHPLVQIALAKFDENTTRAEYLREYGVSRLLKRQPSERESAESIADLCRRAEALLIDQKDQPRVDRVRQRAEELEEMKK